MRPQGQVTIKKLYIKSDERGRLMEVIRKEDVGHGAFGQVLMTTAKPGKVKGGHYHKRKIEWWCVIKGCGLLTFINNISGKKEEYILGQKNMFLVKIPPYNTHFIKNIGNDEMFLLVYINEAFYPSNPDTYAAEVK